ncbi:MAG: hypothetical protein K6G30_14220 [Acetatifactor sp.]|nr:hypothetical protein [Acetatifactor sp.]
MTQCIAKETTDFFRVTTPMLIFTYHKDSKLYDVEFTESIYPMLQGCGFEYRFQNLMFTQAVLIGQEARIYSNAVSNSFGEGMEVIVTHSYGLLSIHQHFQFYDSSRYFLVQLELEGADFIRSNYMSPLSAHGDVFSLRNALSPRLLYVPYDNDKWIRYKAQELQECGISYEVTAVYDDVSRNGYVIGSISHDHWKTGINTHGGYGSLSMLTIYGGVADATTRDTAMPHGEVCGKQISSPLVLVGYYEDIREGLIDYGNANTLYQPRLPWKHGVPFGWNSWACVATNLSYEVYDEASKALAKFQEQGFENNETVYLNFDSFWDRLTPQELKQAVSTIHSRGQKAGIYYTPFTCWTQNFDQVVENTNNQYTYRDILLRDANGQPLPPISGGYPIDPTHPGNLMRVEAMMKMIVDLEFDYLKVDFMSHGSCEGIHYLHTISTGVEAYCYGLTHMLNFLSPENAGRDIFVDFSIAPIFPYQFAHSRRISCDVFGQIYDTEYLLNSLTYGFWQNQTIYTYNDPDHTCIYKCVWRDVSDELEAETRLLASVISGTVLLLSDDYRIPEAFARTQKLLTPELLSIAKKGTTFLPVEMATSDRASRIFYREDEDACYVAVFNFETTTSSVVIDTKRLGQLPDSPSFETLDGLQTYTGEKFTIHLEPKQSLLLRAKK